MSSLWDHIGQALYDGVLGRKDTHLDEFTLLNAWKFFIETAMENPRIALSALSIERKGDHYEILQLMLNEKMDPIKANGDYVIGRSIQAYLLDDDIVEFMDGNKRRIMNLSVLKEKPVKID